jgi:hypothetical protein
VAKKAGPASAAKASSAAKKLNTAKIAAVAKASAVLNKPSAVLNKASAVLNMSSVVRFSDAEKIVTSDIATVTVAEVTALSPPLRSHKFRVGQTVSYTSSPISRPGASGSYQVVRLLPSDGDDYQYRIKNPGEAFERVAKESQLELEH